MSDDGPSFPPPPPGGFPPPPSGYGAGGYPVPSGQLATWGLRVAGYFVDVIPPIAIIFVGFILGSVAHTFFIVALAYLVTFAYWLIQLVRQGTTGQTVGKKVVGLKLVNETSGAPVGAGTSIGRAFAHIVDSVICYIGWLFPLWDPKRQTIADKIVGSVVVVVPKQPFDFADLYTAS
jgi:uncharacterized RDD family membrane protein YckC